MGSDVRHQPQERLAGGQGDSASHDSGRARLNRQCRVAACSPNCQGRVPLRRRQGRPCGLDAQPCPGAGSCRRTRERGQPRLHAHRAIRGFPHAQSRSGRPKSHHGGPAARPDRRGGRNRRGDLLPALRRRVLRHRGRLASGRWARGPIRLSAMAVVAVSDERAELGEGPRLDQRTDQVLWVDILAGRLYRCRLTGGRLQTEAVINVGRHLGAVAPLEKPGAGWVVAAGQGFAQVAEDGTVTTLAEPEAGPGPRTRMNDGACDPAGRFWAGSTAYDETPGAGTLYRLDRDLVVTPVVGGLTISNGIGWSPDATTMS